MEWQPIETAPKDARIRVWAWGAERHARWNSDKYAKRPRPYWDFDGLSVSDSRAHQPQWWLPCAPPPTSASQ